MPGSANSLQKISAVQLVRALAASGVDLGGGRVDAVAVDMERPEQVNGGRVVDSAESA
jgi:hypothetical protein